MDKAVGYTKINRKQQITGADDLIQEQSTDVMIVYARTDVNPSNSSRARLIRPKTTHYDFFRFLS